VLILGRACTAGTDKSGTSAAMDRAVASVGAETSAISDAGRPKKCARSLPLPVAAGRALRGELAVPPACL